MTSENDQLATNDIDQLNDGQKSLLAELARIELKLNRVQVQLLEEFRQLLVNHEGDRFDSIEITREVGSRIQWIITRLGMAAKCPKTNEPATFRGKTNSKSGRSVFEFRRRIDGKQVGTCTSASLPQIPMTSHLKSIPDQQNPKLCAA